MKRFMFTVQEDERQDRNGTVYYCTASFNDSIVGEVDSIEVASRKSRIAAYDICMVRARVMRMKRVSRYMPRITVRASGWFTYTPTLSALGEYATFTAIGESIESAWFNTQELALEVYEQNKETNEERIARQYSSSVRYRPIWPNQTNTPVEPTGFFSWLTNLFK